MNTNDIENEAGSSFVADSLSPKFDQLIDRKKQISQFMSLIDKLSRRKPISNPILQWHGGPGIGKSSLIKLLVAECKNHSILFSLIDFSALGKIEAFYDDPTLLIEKIVFDGWKVSIDDGKPLADSIKNFRTTMKPQEQSFVVSYDKYPQQKISIIPKWLEELEGVRVEFEKLAEKISGARDPLNEKNHIQPVVILFDETEIISREFVYWIEDYVFRPMALLTVSLIVWTGRKPWQWRRPEVRQRVYSEKLEVFNDGDVEIQLKNQLVPEDESDSLAKQLFKNVFNLTGGHPYANGVIINEINSWTDKEMFVTPDSLAQKQPDLFELIFKDFIENYAFKNLPSEQKIACELLGLVRRFDVKMLQEIANAVGALRNKDREGFRDLLNDLKKAQFMDWNQGFVLDQPLRHLISEYYFWRQKNDYVVIHQTALKVNRDWLNTPVDNRALFVTEVIYHNLCLRRAGQSINLKDVVLESLKVFPSENNDALKDTLARFAGELRRDKEVVILFNELEEKHLLSEDDKFVRIISLIEDYSSS